MTSRGGPLVGEEVLLLQGIPAEDLLLTHETEDMLKDLAGNAMSTTGTYKRVVEEPLLT